jgi:hypothetical protein
VSFASAGERNDNGAGKLCGNVTAASLDQVPVPMGHRQVIGLFAQ